MARKALDIFKDLRKGVAASVQETRGPDRYIVSAIASLLHGMELLDEQMMQIDKSVNKFEDQVTRFSTASDKIET